MRRNVHNTSAKCFYKLPRIPRFAFPDDHGMPAQLFQHFGVFAITVFVAKEFRDPVAGVRLRDPSPFAMLMGTPETAVDEQCNGSCGENHVGRAREVGPMKPKSQT